ncbi:redoxin domain-containing protein [Streptomyces sp. NRRL S-646]|uniref:redoxin domain-containing protein n=1 Tax=Streptomyces sp. NRRL S-646 TaxID=1463917 RepID=UPI00068937CA|nr:redoxin domain-containing protein [Streptomyces sp. NRRL S-646]
MASLETAPASVRGWFAAQTSQDAAGDLRAVLAADAVFEFAGRKAQGADAVIDRATSMPAGRLGQVEWNVLPLREAGRVTVRGTGPAGAPLSSPGGPISAMDFSFDLNDEGLIARITPHPHHTEPDDLAQPLKPGQTAPSFTLPDTEGDLVTLRHGEAAATVVVFTCNPCPWALGWHDRLQQVARDYTDHGVRFLQINANDPAVSPKDSVEDSRKRVAAGDFAGPYLVDEGQAVARRWGARHTPDVFVLDAWGVVAYHGAPDAEVDDESLNAAWLRSALRHVLDGTAPEPDRTQPVGCTIKWTL